MRTAFALLALAFAACTVPLANAPTPSAPSGTLTPSGGGVTLAVGQSAALGDDFTLTFHEVLSDSRCPKDVRCMWAGQAELLVGPSHPAMRFRPDTLRLTAGRPDSMDVGPFRVVLTRVEPERLTTAPVPQDRYRATFTVRRAR